MARITGPNNIVGAAAYISQTVLGSGQALGDRIEGSVGKQFVRVKAGASALVVANVIQSPVIDTNFNNLVVAAAAPIGAMQVTVTLGGTGVTLNQFQGGSFVVSAATGIGQERTIISHPAQATTTGNVILTLDAPLAVALDTTSTVTLRNLYNGVIQAPATTLTGTPIGVAIYAIPASSYGWLQVQGEAGVLSDATSIIAGSQVATPSGTAGAATLGIAGLPNIGIASQAASSAKCITVKLQL